MSASLVRDDVTDADVEAVIACYRSGWLTMGPRTQEFEARMAGLLGARHAVAVASGTAALHLALLGVGVRPGEEVAVSALAGAGVLAAVAACGATPALIDICGPTDPTLDAAALAARLGPSTRAVVASHWFGQAADIPALEAVAGAAGVALVEDATQALLTRLGDGRHAGTVGTAGCFSFLAGSQLSVGEGGMLVTGDEAVAARARLLRSHAMTSVTWDRHRGHAESYDILDVGFNYRLDEPRAALALSRLDRLDAAVAQRRATAASYRGALAGVGSLILPGSAATDRRASPAWFAVVLPDAVKRDAARAALADAGVPSTCFDAPATAADAPRAAAVAARHVALPVHAGVSPDDVRAVTEVLAASLRM